MLLGNYKTLYVYPSKRDLLAKPKLRLDGVESVEVTMNIEVDAQRSSMPERVLKFSNVPHGIRCLGNFVPPL